MPGPSTDLRRARNALLLILGVQIAVLAVTGVALFFVYRPTVGQSWGDLFAGSTDSAIRLSQMLRWIHRLASALAVFTALAAGIVVALANRTDGRRWSAAAVGAGITVTAVAASITGFLLPWDQLALSAVKVGTNMGGYLPMFDPTVRFVLLGGVELSRGTVVLWLLVHAVVLGPLLAGLGAVSALRCGRR